MSILPVYENVESSSNSKPQTILSLFDEPANATICHAPRCKFKTPSFLPSKLNLDDVYKVEHIENNNEQENKSYENILEVYTTNIVTISSHTDHFIKNSFSISTHISNDPTNSSSNNDNDNNNPTIKNNESIQNSSLSILDALQLFSLKL